MLAATLDQAVPSATTDLEQIYLAHQGRVFRAAYRITGNVTDAEDVLQTVFLRLVRQQGVQADTNLESYLYRAAINGALDLLRSRQTSPQVPLEAGEHTASGAWDEEVASLRQWFRVALSRISARPAEMFALRYLEGRDNREIAQLLGTSTAVVAVTLMRVRRQLQREYESFQKSKR